MNSYDSLTYNNSFSFGKLSLLITLLFITKIGFANINFSISNDSLTEKNKKFKVGLITVSGNNKTKNSIILRELTFKTQDTIDTKTIEQIIKRSEQNLLNTSLFNFATITYELSENDSVLMFHIKISERWYLWPSPVFEIQDRNFNTWWETKDLFRINYGMFLSMYNVRGRNETAVLKFRKGYTELYGFSYKIPYLDKKQNLGANVSVNYSRNNEVAFNTENNKLLFTRNYTNYLKSDLECKLGFTYRKGIYARHVLDLLYTKKQISDEVMKLNSNYFTNEINHAEFLSIQYRYKHDLRDSRIFPLKGNYFELYLCKDGLNVLNNENIDNFSAEGIFKNYWQPFKRISIGSSLRFRYKQMQNKSYFFNQALGYNEFVRGYEYYVIDGQTFSVLKTNINYQLIQPKLVKLPLQKLEKFNKIPYSVFVSAHADAGFVKDKFFYASNFLNNKTIYGFGAGISLVTYYDFVLRLDYSINHLKENGVFVHFMAPL
jgi:outer membrane protein assembly factor BamA